MLRTLVRSLALVAILAGTALAAGDSPADMTGKVETQKTVKQTVKKKSPRKAKKKAARKNHKKKAKKATKSPNAMSAEAPAVRHPTP